MYCRKTKKQIFVVWSSSKNNCKELFTVQIRCWALNLILNSFKFVEKVCFVRCKRMLLALHVKFISLLFFFYCLLVKVFSRIWWLRIFIDVNMIRWSSSHLLNTGIVIWYNERETIYLLNFKHWPSIAWQ